MKQIGNILFFGALVLALSNCGGGSDSGTGNENGNGNGNGEDIQAPTGHVGDGYIEGAYVCHDTNNNQDCLDESIHAVTDANGAFSLSNYDPTHALLVQIPVGAKDNGPFADGSTAPRTFTQSVWYYYPPSAASGTVFVSPLTTMVYAQMQSVPGMSLEDACNVVSAMTGVPCEFIMDDYLDGNTSQENDAQFAAELIGSTLTAAANSTSSQPLQDVLSTLGAVGQTVATSNPITTNTQTYGTNAVTPSTTAAYIFTPVADVCDELDKAQIYALEEWDTGGAKEHKTMYIKNDPGGQTQSLQIETLVYRASSWQIDGAHTTHDPSYLQKIEGYVIDMDYVNSTTVNYTAPRHDIPFPAQKVGCSGSSATFKIGAMQFKLYVSEMDINGIQGSALPKGPTVGQIVDSVTFGMQDKLYKSTMVLQNNAYMVRKSQNVIGGAVVNGPLGDYAVHDTTFNPMPYNTSLSSLSTFVIKYRDQNNYDKVVLNAAMNIATVTSHNGTNTVGVSGPKNVVTQTHNGHTFLVIEDYEGIGTDLFIGKIDAISNTNLVYGFIYHAGKTADISEGAGLHGDIMDDIMINASSRNKTLNIFGNSGNGTQHPFPPLPAL